MPLNLTDFNHFYIINKVCGLEKQRHYLEALGRKEFQIYFQLKISGKSQKIASAEVLIRWKRADGELWFPDSFLPILEETGEIEALDYYVYEAAFQWLANRRSAGLKLLPLSLNVSPVHFRKIHTFTKKVLQLIQKYEIPSDGSGYNTLGDSSGSPGVRSRMTGSGTPTEGPARKSSP